MNFKILVLTALSATLFASCAVEAVDEATPNAGPHLATKMYYTADVNNWLPLQLNSTFVWGVNGHTFTQEAYTDYNSGSIETEVNFLKELGMNYYRVDMQFDTITNDGTITSGALPRLNTLISQAGPNIKILPVVYLLGLDYTASDSVNYNKGFAVGQNFATLYGANFTYYEIGNEEENKGGVKVSEGTDGSSTSHYNSIKMQRLSQYYKGMISGIKSINLNAKIIINNAGWLHYGFFQILINKGVQFDIIGTHWYSDMESLTSAPWQQVMTAFNAMAPNKPIWITEINRRFGSRAGNQGSFDEDDADKELSQAKVMQTFIRNLDTQTRIQAFFVYELYDQPVFLTDTDTSNDGEATYGITKWITSTQPPVRKKAFTTTKFFIEETKNGYKDYIYSLYLILNNAAPTTSQLVTWSDTFKFNRNKVTTVTNLMKEKYHDTFVESLYTSLLSRASDASSKAVYVNQLKDGTATREGLIKAFCLSSEFWSKSVIGASTTPSNEGFVKRVYNKLLGREPDSPYWANQLNSLARTKENFIDETLASEEYRKKFIMAQFVALHGREATEADKTYWYGQMQGGMSQLGLIITTLTLNECWEKAIQDGYERNNPLFDFE